VPPYFTGTRLLPVQAVESAGVATLVAAGVITVLAGAEPGIAAALYVTGYAVLRFGLEWLRGDLGRRTARGLSEAQWTSVVLSVLVVVGGWTGVLPAATWHAVAAALLTAVAVVLAVRGVPPRRLLDPGHVEELRHLLMHAPATAPGTTVTVRRTSLGIGLSHGQIDGREHYAVSGPGLSGQRATDVARAILWLRHAGQDGEIVAGPAGVYHVVVRPLGSARL
jgi:hypothetical protein